jgi:integrase
MSRAPTGQVIEREWERKDGTRGRTFAVRFRSGGKRHYITTTAASREEAESELANVLADVRRGIWRPPAAAPQVEAPKEEPTFHEFASEWFAQREQEGLKAKTLTDLRWSLERHLLPFFAGHHLSEITPREVKRYTQAKLAERNAIEGARAAALARGERFAERPLSNGSVNHTLRHLAQILEAAADDELIASNPATGKRRRLKATKPARPWVEPEQLMPLLDATSGVGHVLFSLLAGGGLRIGEALALRWQHVELGTSTLYVVDAKTSKGVREVHLTPALRETLAFWRNDAKHIAPDAHVIHTATGRKHHPSNLRRDVLAPAVEKANAKLGRDGIAPIGRVTFHSLRRSYASLRCACGDDVRYTADQLGHEDPRFTLRVYTQATKRRDRLAGPHLRAYDRAIEWAQMGTHGALVVPALQMEATKDPA